MTNTVLKVSHCLLLVVKDRPVFNMHWLSICLLLQGLYGLKRFLRDGYKTVVEDKNRRYYEKRELQVHCTNH